MTEIIGRALGEAIDLETELASDARPVYADRNQLESVLLNLVVNARDAMPQGGRLCIRTGNEDVAGVSAGRRAGVLCHADSQRHRAVASRTSTSIACSIPSSRRRMREKGRGSVCRWRMGS
jgi:signal transduction histidine kinase